MASPRVWGRLAGERLPGRAGRFIPTRVGQTASPRSGSSRSRSVHPHACVGQTLGPVPRPEAAPRFIPACGADSGLVVHRVAVSRFIPTRVGQTRGMARRCVSLAVHPHACGADEDRQPAGLPRARFIPTRVGQTTTEVTENDRACGSSPRVWGRRTLRLNTPARSTGSSPRVWGRRARARLGLQRPSVHPHACGADAEEDWPPTATTGSSPRVWGRLAGANGHQPDLRFIPTRVGQTVMGRADGWVIGRFIPTRVGQTHRKH